MARLDVEGELGLGEELEGEVPGHGRLEHALQTEQQNDAGMEEHYWSALTAVGMGFWPVCRELRLIRDLRMQGCSSADVRTAEQADACN